LQAEIARLAGTVLLPNGLFKGKRTDVMAGYQLANGTVISSSDASLPQEVPGLGRVQVVGKDGRLMAKSFVHKQVFTFVNILIQL
jgi:hypothetical protein